MTWRRAAFYWTCFAVLSAYYLIVLRRPAAPAAAHLTRASFLEVPENQVEGIDVRNGSTVARCRRSGERWQVVEPAGAVVPSDLVAALVANLTQLPDVEVVEENATDLAQFGLDPPASLLTVILDHGRTLSVRIGNRNPSSTAVYAQRSDSPRVYLIGLNVRYYEDLLLEALGRASS